MDFARLLGSVVLLGLTVPACGAEPTPPNAPAVATAPTDSGTPSTSVAPPDASVAPPASSSASAGDVASAPPAPDAPSAPEPPAIACKTEDDCWFDDAMKPARRPAKLRGKRIAPCKSGEHVPKCVDGACVVRAYKC